MMFLLFDWITAERKAFEALTAAQARTYIAACISRALDQNRPHFAAALPQGKLARVSAMVDWLWQHKADEQAPTSEALRLKEEVIEMMPEEGSKEDFVPGWVFLLDAVAGAMTCFRGSEVRSRFDDAVGAAYQSTIAQDFQRALREYGGFDEAGMRAYEAASPVCQQERAFHRDCLRRIATGETIVR